MSSDTGSREFQVLLYHGLYRDAREIEGEPAEDFVSEDDFSRQVRWMRENGFTLLSLRRCRDLADSGELPPRGVCITFDDGKQSDLRLAVPILCEVSAEATFFVIPSWIGTANILDARQIRELVACGMEIGSHSLTHPFLTELDDEGLDREAGESRRFLEDLLGVAVESFSYPFGDVDSRVRRAVESAGYRIGCGTRRGRNSIGSDWLLLRRWGVPGSAGLEGLQRILSSRAPSWREAALEMVKNKAGMRRFTAWKERWARRAGGAGHD